jgi:hypothetical protein
MDAMKTSREDIIAEIDDYFCDRAGPKTPTTLLEKLAYRARVELSQFPAPVAPPEGEDERIDAWHQVFEALRTAVPGMCDLAPRGVDCALLAIERLARAPAQVPPREPTEAMLEAGKDERMECFKTEGVVDGKWNRPLSVGQALARIWRAMYDAAPQAERAPEQCERCGGSGEIVTANDDLDPRHDTSYPCPECSPAPEPIEWLKIPLGEPQFDSKSEPDPDDHDGDADLRRP